MDSVTQITLGAAIGEATLGRRVGYRAALWGGICGTLPDLDNFIPYADAVATVTYHRSFSHSLIVLACITPFMARLIEWVHPGTAIHHRRWLLLVFLVVMTHALLDAFTVYGTQLLWPFLEYPFSWSTIFIIDPAYTLLLLLGVIAALVLSRTHNTGHYLNYAGLVLSSLYLLWTVAAKFYVEERAVTSLQEKGIEYTKVLSTPTPFNSILWRFVAMGPGGYYEGFYSVLDENGGIQWNHYVHDESLLEDIEHHWTVQRLKWFTHGFYSVVLSGDDILMIDLRMGMEPAYPFRYRIAELANPHPRMVTSRLAPAEWREEQLQWLWHRLLNPES